MKISNHIELFELENLELVWLHWSFYMLRILYFLLYLNFNLVHLWSNLLWLKLWLLDSYWSNIISDPFNVSSFWMKPMTNTSFKFRMVNFDHSIAFNSISWLETSPWSWEKNLESPDLLYLYLLSLLYLYYLHSFACLH